MVGIEIPSPCLLSLTKSEKRSEKEMMTRKEVKLKVDLGLDLWRF